MYKAISEQYQGAEKYFYLYLISVFIALNYAIVYCCVKLSMEPIAKLSLNFNFNFG